MEGREEGKDMRGTSSAGLACGSDGADGRNVELRHDGGQNRRRQLIQAIDARSLLHHHQIPFSLCGIRDRRLIWVANSLLILIGLMIE